VCANLEEFCSNTSEEFLSPNQPAMLSGGSLQGSVFQLAGLGARQWLALYPGPSNQGLVSTVCAWHASIFRDFSEFGYSLDIFATSIIMGHPYTWPVWLKFTQLATSIAASSLMRERGGGLPVELYSSFTAYCVFTKPGATVVFVRYLAVYLPFH